MKHHEQHARLAFNEQKALEDLQRLHREIQRARGDRERAESDFDTLVRGFREGPPAPVPPRSRQPRAPRVEEAPLTPAPSPAAAPAPEIAVAPPSAPADEPREITGSVPVSSVPRKRRVVPAVVAAVVILGGVFAARFWKATPPAEERPRVSASPTHPAPATAVPKPAEPPRPATTSVAPQPAPPRSGVSVELVTRRAVWVRVFVDGRRAVEREIPAGQRLPLRASRTIVVRAGDAGAVSVVVNGRDEGPLGRDGAIATRAFAAQTR